MQKPLVRMVKVNGLQYNANRDPQAYRRAVGEAFRIEALLEGAGEAQCTVSDEHGGVMAEEDLMTMDEATARWRGPKRSFVDG